MKNHIFFAVALLTAPSAKAQQLTIIQSPEVGVETIVPAGGDVYSYFKVYTIDGVRTEAATKAGDWLLEQPVPTGTELVPVTTKAKFKACVPYPNSFDARGPCFLDDDGDGRFDRQARDDATMARKVKTPVPYSKVAISVARSDSFKQIILYQGATADSLRFSYREFKDDMARPAFTEELTIPREPFPAMILVKNLQLEIAGVTGMGLRYTLVKIK